MKASHEIASSYAVRVAEKQTQQKRNSMTKRQENKKRQDQLSITINGYKKRIKEQKQDIKAARKNIKKFKLLKKQAKTAAKLELL